MLEGGMEATYGADAQAMAEAEAIADSVVADALAEAQALDPTFDPFTSDVDPVLDNLPDTDFGPDPDLADETIGGYHSVAAAGMAIGGGHTTYVTDIHNDETRPLTRAGAAPKYEPMTEERYREHLKHIKAQTDDGLSGVVSGAIAILIVMVLLVLAPALAGLGG